MEELAMKRLMMLLAALGLLVALAAVSFSEDYPKGTPEEVALRFVHHVFAFESREAMTLVVAEQQAKVDWSKVEAKRKAVSGPLLQHMAKTMNTFYELRKTDNKEYGPEHIEITFDVFIRDMEQLSAEQQLLMIHLGNFDRVQQLAKDEIKERTAKLAELEKALADLPFVPEEVITIVLVRENGAWRIRFVDDEPAAESVFFYMDSPIVATPDDYDADARSAGRAAGLAEELFYQSQASEPQYTDRLSELLKWDEHLTDDPEVTFVFGSCEGSGFTFTTSHAKGNKKQVFTN